MNRKILYWLLAGLGSLLCLAFALTVGKSADSYLDAEITMSRDEAIRAAGARAAQLHLAPADAQHAIRFLTNEEAIVFVQLEGGGKPALTRLIADGAIDPLRWEVRFFREGNPHEATLFFSPRGKPLGFVQRIADTEQVAALDAERARHVAEEAAARDWNIVLAGPSSPYQLVEQSFDRRPSGRVDHSLVYEKRDLRLGNEGRARLAVTIAGDRMTRIEPVILVPGAFQREFKRMRSANEFIGMTGSVGLILFAVAGCMAAMMWLRRRGMLIVGPAVRWAGVAAALQFATAAAGLPSAWFGYDTAQPAANFVAQHMLTALGSSLIWWVFLSLCFASAESLTRKAFGSHPQLWQTWRIGAGNSRAILGRTAGAYLWTGYHLAYVAVFYMLAQRWFGWWHPLKPASDPNMLASALPWLAPVTASLWSGLIDECLGRAIPLAGAALLGDFLSRRFGGRFGTRKTWIAIALVVQALVFSAVHAAYPQQPAHARLVEMLLPSLLAGLLYLRFGLFAVIAGHAIYDLFPLSAPIFLADDGSLLLDRAIIILFALEPMMMVWRAKLRAGRWQDLPASLTNAGWQAPAAAAPQAAPAQTAPDTTSVAWQRIRKAIPWLGAAGLAAWLIATPFKQDGLPLDITRAQAEAAADEALKARGVDPTTWTRLSAIVPAVGDDHQFVWETGGRAAYTALLGTYLRPIYWEVRYQRFDGSDLERAEKWIVRVESGVDGRGGKDAQPHIRNVNHDIPEAAPGKSISVDAARALAHRAIAERYRIDPAGLREVSAVESRRPNRLDWRFFLADDAAPRVGEAEARIEAYVAGDEVTFVGRSLEVPQTWVRAKTERDSLLTNLRNIAFSVFQLLLLCAGVAALVYDGSDNRLLFRTFLVLLPLVLFTFGGNWEALAMNLNTAQPLSAQLGQMIPGMVIFLLGMHLYSSRLIAINAHQARAGVLGKASFSSRVLPGLAVAALWNGIATLLWLHDRNVTPQWESLAIPNSSMPVLWAFTSSLTMSVQKIASHAFIFGLMYRISHGFTRRRVLALMLMVPVGLSTAAPTASLTGFALQAIGNTLFLIAMMWWIGRFEPKVALLPLLPSIFMPISTAIIAPYPQAWLCSLMQLAGIAAGTAWWVWCIEKYQGKKTSANTP